MKAMAVYFSPYPTVSDLRLGQLEPPTGPPRGFGTDAEAVAFIVKFLDWMAKSEKNMIEWHAQLAIAVSLQAANCEEIRHYNTVAIGLYGWESLALEKFRQAGVRGLPEDAAFPPLFAHSVSSVRSTDGTSTIDAHLLCESDGYPSYATLRHVVSDPCPATELGAVMAMPGVCAAGPYALAACGLLAALTATLVIFGDRIIRRVLDFFSGADIAAINRVTFKEEGKQDAATMSFINECAFNQIRLLSAAERTADRVRSIYDQCRAIAPEQREGPRARPWFAYAVFGIVTVVGGTFVVRAIGKARAARREAEAA